jgi:hypothetical protein
MRVVINFRFDKEGSKEFDRFTRDIVKFSHAVDFDGPPWFSFDPNDNMRMICFCLNVLDKEAIKHLFA